MRFEGKVYKAREEGAKAYRAGKPITDNKYIYLTDFIALSCHFEAGWLNEKSKDSKGEVHV